MKVVDANVLLYAVNSDARHHEPGDPLADVALAEAPRRLAFRGSASLRLFGWGLIHRSCPGRFGATDAFDLVDSWLAQPAATVVDPTTRHSSILRGLLEQAGTAGNLTTDAHLAALAIEHGAQVATFDRNVAQVGVKVCLPG